MERSLLANDMDRAIYERAPRRRMLPILAMVSLVAAGMLLGPVSPASAVTFSNACVNSAVPTDATQLDVTLTGNAPASVAPGASFQLTSISQTLFLPGALFLAGYNLGLLQVGENTVPGTIKTVIEGTNTIEGTQTTPITAIAITFTITDPDGTPGTGDETATDASVTVNYPDQTWTAGPAGAIEFREDTVTPLSTTVGGIVITATIGGFLTVRFGCDPGTVGSGGLVGDITLIDPAPAFASTTSQSGGNSAPTANAGPDQSVASGASVNLDGTASSDPDLDSLTYAWSQSTGPSVTLSDASVAAPSFTAPTGPASLTFDLQVCDPSNACDTDSVMITVAAPGADLAVAISAASKPVNGHKPVTITIIVKNLGPDATLASLTNYLPPESQLVSFATSQGSCNAPPVGSTGTMTCTLGSLASGATATVTVTIKPTVRKQTISDTAIVAPVSPTIDPISANNTATVAIQVK